MYNLRYHIVSLVSVFLALALGLILGGLTVSTGMVDRQEKSLVDGLQREFAQLREDNRTLTNENKVLAAFTADAVEAWSAGKLKDRTVLVIGGPGLNASVDDVREAVESAGGRIAVVQLTKANFGLDNPEPSGQIASLAPDPEAPAESIAASLSAEWLAPGAPRPLTAAFVEAGIIKLEGLEDDTVVSAVVNLVTAGDESDPAGVLLTRSYADLGLIVVSAERPDSETGIAREASRLGQSGLDTLGTTTGNYTLVALLAGEAKGYYGTGQGATDPYPPVKVP